MKRFFEADPTVGYFEQKQGALEGGANYDWFVGPGYDKIPTSVYAKGFGEAFSDKRREDVTQDPLAYKNLPINRQNLYGAHANDQVPLGFYLWDDARPALDVAPILVHRAPWGVGLVGSCLRGEQQKALGHCLVGGTHVGEQPLVQRDPGNVLGLLFEEPILPPYQSGTSMSFY